MNFADTTMFSDSKIFSIVPATGVERDEVRAISYSLSQNYPNPFNPATTIRFSVPQKAHVTLNILNTLGQQVAQLVNEEKNAGYYDVRFDGSNLASGVYFYRIQSANGFSGPGQTFVETKKLILIR
jgi:hypothetical protein